MVCYNIYVNKTCTKCEISKPIEDFHKSAWTIDHIKPQASFHYTDFGDPEFQECWALKNLRPLEYIANIRKGDRFIA